MSLLTRVLLTGAVIYGVVHVFRRDLLRVVSVLRAPAANFVKDVKRELEGDEGSKGAAIGGGGEAEKAAAAGAAAASVRSGEADAPPAQGSAPPSGDKLQ